MRSELAVLVAFSLFSGCSCDTNRKSEEVVLSGHPKWSSARLVLQAFDHATYFGPMGGPTAGGELRLELVHRNEAATFHPAKLALEGILNTSDPGPARAARFAALEASRPAIAAAADGHAVAVSFDGGTTWRRVALDANDAPLFCPHDVRPGPGAAVAALPTRELVLGILASDRGTGHAVEHEVEGLGASSEQRRGDEYRGAFRFVGHHPEDEGLAVALAVWLTTAGRPTFEEIGAKAESGESLQRHPRAKELVLAALAGEGLSAQKRADLLEVLRNSRDPDFKKLLPERR